MAEPNDLLRGARERTESPHASGDCLSREELADLINAWLFEQTGGLRAELDSNHQGHREYWAELDRRAAAQRDDGGWTVDWDSFSVAGTFEWRGWATVRALKILRANNRF